MAGSAKAENTAKLNSIFFITISKNAGEGVKGKERPRSQSLRWC